MKCYSLLVCAALCSSPVLGDPNQLTGSLSDLSRALQKLQQKLAPTPQWEQDVQKLADRMTLIWQTIQTCQYSANDIKDYKNLLAQYRQLIKANNAEVSYRSELESYAVLPFEAEMNCLIVQFDQIMQAQSALDPQLINAYEKVYNEFIKEIPASQVDPNYKGWLDAVQDYVAQFAAGVVTRKPSRPLPSIPVKKPAPTTEPTKKPTKEKSALSFLEQISAGKELKPVEISTESKPAKKLSEEERLILERRRVFEEEMTAEEAREEAERIAEDIAKATRLQEAEEAKRLEQERKKQELEAQHPKGSISMGEQFTKFKEKTPEPTEPEVKSEVEEGEWEEESIEETLKKEKEREQRRERELVDNTTKTRFALSQKENDKNVINNQRREKGLDLLPGAYYSGEEQQIRDYYDKNSRRDYLIKGILVSERVDIDNDRQRYGFELLGSRYPEQFEAFEKQKQLEELHPRDQVVHDETVLQLFIEKDLYKNRPEKLQEALKYINEERGKARLLPLSL